MAPDFQHWLLRQMNAHDALDGVAVTVKLAVREFGPRKIARELRRFARQLENEGKLPGWNFPDSRNATLIRKPRLN